jgi:hypothetical protein
MFQFHHGEIKRKEGEYVMTLIKEFQFHHGEIKRRGFYLFEATFQEFQFHHGEIKRGIAKNVNYFAYGGFNSIMERLKEFSS